MVTMYNEKQNIHSYNNVRKFMDLESHEASALK